VWGSSGSDVFAVGRSGTILHYDGIAWSPMSSGTDDYLYGVWGNSGSDIFAVGGDGTILHYPAPAAAEFTASPRSGLAPLEVSFTNQSTGVYTETLWAFGDGETSTDANSTYTYTVTGSYTVTLTVSGLGGTDTETKPHYILAASDRVYLPVVLRTQ
jgi:PKD repeat protein